MLLHNGNDPNENTAFWKQFCISEAEHFSDSPATADEMMSDIWKTVLMVTLFIMPVQGLTYFGDRCKQVLFVKLAWSSIKDLCVSSLFCIFTAENYLAGSAVSYSSENKLVNKQKLSSSDYIICSLRIYMILVWLFSGVALGVPMSVW